MLGGRIVFEASKIPRGWEQTDELELDIDSSLLHQDIKYKMMVNVLTKKDGRLMFCVLRTDTICGGRRRR